MPLNLHIGITQTTDEKTLNIKADGDFTPDILALFLNFAGVNRPMPFES